MAIRAAAIAAIGTVTICGGLLSAPADSAVPQDSDTQRATSIIKPGALSKGQRPQALYRHERRIHDGKRSFEIRGPKRLDLVGEGDGGYLAVHYGSYHGHLWQLRPRRKARRLGLVAQAAYNGGDQYTVSDNGNRLAITEPERAGSMMWVRALPSGTLIRHRFLSSWIRTVAFPKNRVLLATDESTYWYAPKKNESTEVTDESAVIAEPDENRMIIAGDRDEPRFRLVAFDDPSTVLAQWQHGRALAISPDGEHFLAKAGRHRLQIRSLHDGTLVRTFTAPDRIATGSARWESARRVLFSARGHRVAANVRCTVSGACQRTTRLASKIGRLGLDWP